MIITDLCVLDGEQKKRGIGEVPFCSPVNYPLFRMPNRISHWYPAVPAAEDGECGTRAAMHSPFSIAHGSS